AEREKAKRHVAQARAVATSLRLDDVAGRYWGEVGEHHAGAGNTERPGGDPSGHFGKEKGFTRIRARDRGRARARSAGRACGQGGRLISAFTVNDTTEQLKKLFTRAKLWGVVFAREPQWKRHWLAEPQERVRELVGDEAERLDAATRDDYAPFFAFARASGLR